MIYSDTSAVYLLMMVMWKFLCRKYWPNKACGKPMKRGSTAQFLDGSHCLQQSSAVLCRFSNTKFDMLNWIIVAFWNDSRDNGFVMQYTDPDKSHSKWKSGMTELNAIGKLAAVHNWEGRCTKQNCTFVEELICLSLAMMMFFCQILQ